MNNNNQIFLDFWDNYHWPEIKIENYRLYHDDDGNPIVYSTEDLPGKYIEITQQQYNEHNYRVSVKNGKIITKSQNLIVTKKLVPHQSGTSCYPTNVTVVVTDTPNQPWKLKNYDNN
jgi:hypothetical protein